MYARVGITTRRRRTRWSCRPTRSSISAAAAACSCRRTTSRCSAPFRSAPNRRDVVEILGGLVEGDTVITTGAAALRDGDRVLISGAAARPSRRRQAQGDAGAATPGSGVVATAPVRAARPSALRRADSGSAPIARSETAPARAKGAGRRDGRRSAAKARAGRAARQRTRPRRAAGWPRSRRRAGTSSGTSCRFPGRAKSWAAGHSRDVIVRVLI